MRPHLVVRLPGRYIKGVAHREDTPATSAGSDSSVDELVHNVAHVLKISLRSGRQREPGGEVCDVAFSAGLPGGVQLSQLPTVREAMAAPDSDGWWEAMDREMENLKSHDVYQLVPHASGCALSVSDGCCTGNSRTGRLTKTRRASLRTGTVNDLALTTMNRSCP